MSTSNNILAPFSRFLHLAAAEAHIRQAVAFYLANQPGLRVDAALRSLGHRRTYVVG